MGTFQQSTSTSTSNMKFVVLSLALFGLIYADDWEHACVGQPDGSVPVYGCVGYTRCEGGEQEYIDCTPNVFNPKTLTCDDRANVEPPCGLNADCSKQKDGKYAADECKAYYTCQNGVYLGHNPCPGGLKFNEKLQICDWEFNLPPPCGTKTF